MYGTRPIATSTTSASMVSAVPPPAAGSILTFRIFPEVSTAVTLDESLNVIPCFCWMRWNCRATSLSMPGRM